MRYPLIKSLIHISPGSIPSQYAHTVQIMRMAEVLSQKIPNFELLTSGDLLSIITRRNPALRDSYGLHNAFRITRIPARWAKRYSLDEHYCGGVFYYRLAALYCMMKSPSLIYARTFAGIEILLKTGLPVIWEHHTTLDERFFQDIGVYSNLIGLVATTTTLGDIAVGGGLSPDKILVEQNAVDLGSFQPYKTKDEARKILNLDTRRPLVTYVGHLYERKGSGTILDTAALMPSCDFILVGGWEKDVEALKETCAARKLGNIRLTGHLSQAVLKDYFYAADVLILPTTDHPDHTVMGSQLKLFEYMASRRPFVASALPSVKAVVKDGVNGLLAEPGNASSFSGAIKRLLEDPDLGERLSAEAYKDVQYYTWDKRAERILGFAEKMLSAPARHRRS